MSSRLQAMLAKDPPKKPLVSLEAFVCDWKYRFTGDGPEAHRRDQVVEYTAQAVSFNEATARACASRCSKGKCHNHQSRVPENVRRLFCELITCEWPLANVKDFDTLYDWLDTIKPAGIGPVTLYDVATRIGAYLGYEVQSLYLHAGVHLGWARLHGKRMPLILRIPKDELPLPLQSLPTDEIEDFLCCYREMFPLGLIK